MSVDEVKTRERRPWRENLEALTMAIIVALLFKYFILEISKIPSGSMQPTLIGSPQAGVFDRVLVDKLSLRVREPRRFEVVVFKHPLERSRIMVKRLVGMPGEELRIAEGDLWTRPDEAQPWRILRRPDPVQEEMWRRLEPGRPLPASWDVVGGEGWSSGEAFFEAPGPGRLRFRADQNRIVDSYLDGYPPSVAEDIRPRNPASGRHAVGDVRVEGRFRPGSAEAGLALELTEGTRTYRFVVAGAGLDGGAGIRVSDRGIGGLEREVEAADPVELRPGDWIELAAENLDDRLSLEVDGREVASLEIDPARSQNATVSIEVLGNGGGELRDLAVFRDIYYIPHRGPSWAVAVPPGHYVVLGDNTQDSADSRDWEAKRYRWEGNEGEQEALGNFRREGENPAYGYGPDGTELLRFRDEWGETHWITRADASPGLEVPSPLVPRELIHGRALAVFWPIRPLRGIWRLGWLP